MCETWCISKPTLPLFFSNQEIIYSPAEHGGDRGRAKGGLAACLSSKNCVTLVLFTSNNLLLIYIEIRHLKFVLGVVYFSPLSDNESILSVLKEQLNSVMVKYVNYPIFICRDFNARIGNNNNPIEENTLFNSNISCDRASIDTVVNTRGKLLLDLIEDIGFSVINGRSNSDNPAQFTNINYNGCAVIDLILANEKGIDCISDFKVECIPVQSTHFPIVLTLIDKNYDTAVVKEKITLKWKEELAVLYMNSIAYSPHVSHLNLCVNDLNTNLETFITNVASQSGMLKRNFCSTNKKPWHNTEYENARLMLKNSLITCKNLHFSRESLQEYRASKKFFIKTQKSCLIVYKNKIIENIVGSKNPQDFWKALNIHRKKNLNSYQNKISLDQWYQYFNACNMVSAPVLDSLPDTPVSIPEMDSPFSLDEICNSLRSCKNGKAAGENGITYEFLKNLPNNWILFINILFNKILINEKTPDSWSNVIIKMLYKKKVT